MTNLLALDCTDRACSVAVKAGENVLEIHLDEQRLHAKRLLGLIQDSLQQSGIQKTELDAVVWARGPGSFTGLRIAAACVQGLCFGLKIPAIGVSSLMAMALRAKELSAKPKQKVWVGIDAKMGEIYTASFAMNFESFDCQIIEEERLFPAGKIALPPGFDVYLGSALQLVEHNQNSGVFDQAAQIHASDLLRLPQTYLQPTAHHKDIEPVYLRRANAWKKMGNA